MTKDEAMKLAQAACREGRTPLYTARPKREWVGFYPIERKNLAMAVMAQIQISGANMKGLENAILFIEEQLKEKSK